MKDLIKVALAEVKKIADGIAEAKDHFSGVKPLDEEITHSDKVDIEKLKSLTKK